MSTKPSAPLLFQLTVHKRPCLDASLSSICAEHTPTQLLLTVLLCLTGPLQAVHQCAGTLWGPERGHPGSLLFCSSQASVSQSAHNTTLLPLQLAALPSPSPRTACLSTRQGPTRLRSGWGREPIWLLIRFLYLRLTLLILSAAATQAGGLGLLERERDCVVQYSKHMCVLCMCEVELCTFFRPLARLYKAHFSLHETQNLEWLNMVKEF